MNDADLRPLNKAAELRQAFDRSFAEAPAADAALFDDFLAIRLGADPHLLPLAEVARLLPLRGLTRLPSPTPGAAPELLGIVGIAGAVVPVYDLRVLLGYPAGEPPRWIVVCAGAPLALAFDAFDGQLRHPREAGPSTRAQVLRTAGQARPVVAVASILANIKARTPAGAAQSKER